MKFRLPLFLISAAMLASCGGAPSSGLSTPSEASQAGEHLYLDWVANNKIVIDLFDAGSASFAYGNAALSQASNTLDLNANSKLTCSTALEAGQLVNFVYVTEATEGTGFKAGAALYSGIIGTELSNFLDGNDDLSGKVRAYVAISFGSEVKWTKGKNAAMDAKITSLVRASN